VGRLPRDLRERQILAAAAEEFGLRGYHAVCVGDIAARVGVTKTLLHRYFGGKHDLYLACVAWAGQDLLVAIEDSGLCGGVGEGLEPRVRLRGLFAALEGRRAAWLLMDDATHQRTGGPVAYAATRCRAEVDRIAICVGDARRLSDDDPLEADALQHARQGLLTALVCWWIRHPEQSADAMADRCAQLLTVPSAAAT
jgi:AcrR family transcriptional regulator